MGFRRKKRILAAAKSPSLEAMKRTYKRAFENGGVTVDFSANVENIRDISRKLGYNVFRDATFCYVPASYGESKNFAQFKNSSITNSDFAFTRATSSRTTNKLGIIEDSAYNLLQRGNEFNNAYWTRVGVTVTDNSTTSPGNALNACKVVESAINEAHSVAVNNFTQVYANVTYTMSLYVKKAERDCVRVRLNTTEFVNGALYVNLTTKTAYIVESGIVSYLIEDAPNDFVRISISSQCVVDGFVGISINLLTTNQAATGLASYAGDGVSGLYIYGAQVNQGLIRPYLKTTDRLNIPCLDYSLSLLKPGLLIEPQSTNLLLQSETLTNASWVKNNSTATLNTNINPFGTTKSYYLAEDTNVASHYITQSRSVTSGTNYTASFYVKKAAHSWIQLGLETSTFNANTWINFNFDTGLFGSSGFGGLWFKRQLPNGWWHIVVTEPAGATTTNNTLYVAGTSNADIASKLPTYAGASANVCDIAAMQMEARNFYTSYIPTTTATVTRNGETSFVDMQPNSLLNQTNFTLFWEGFLYDGETTNMSFCLSDTSTSATNSNQIGWFDSVQPFYNIGGVRTNSGISILEYSPSKLAIQYSNGTVTFYVDGVSTWTQSVAVFNYRYLILNNGGSTFATDKIVLFNRTLTNTECIDLTTP